MPGVDAEIAIVVRTVNAVLWTIWAVQTFRRDVPIIRLARQMVLPVIVFGMWVLVLGGLVSIQLVNGETARTIYTLFTAFAATVAGTLVVNNWMDRVGVEVDIHRGSAEPKREDGMVEDAKEES